VNNHVHTGFVAFIEIGVYALIFFNLWKIAAAHLANSDNPTLAGLGASAGALVKL